MDNLTISTFDEVESCDSTETTEVIETIEETSTEETGVDVQQPLSTGAIANYTLEEHKNFDNKLDLGQVTAQELKETFERAVASEELIKAQLRKLKVIELKKLLRGYFYHSDKKEYLVTKVYDNMLMAFIVSESFIYQPFSETYQTAIRREVSKVTDEKIQERAKKLLERRESFKKALANPETKEEFETFIHYRGIAKLSPEQKIAWDEIQAGRSLAKKEQELAKKAVIAQVDLGDVKFELVKHFHTHRNHDVFIVTMSERVSREVFEDLCQKARRLGGDYEKAWRNKQTGVLSPSGFMFNQEQQAQKFMQLKDGDVSKIDEIKAHQEEVQENTVEKLQDIADRLKEKAQESLSRPRLANTIRRAGMAASAEKEASKNLALAETIKNVTEGITEGKLKFLNNVKAKTHFELLESLLIKAKYNCGRAKNERWDNLNEREITVTDIEYCTYPYPKIDFSLFKEAIEVALKVTGANLLAKRLKRWYLQESKDAITLYTIENVASLKQLISKLKNSRVHSAGYYAERLSAILIDHDRLQSMNITDEFVLRAALREYLEYRKAHIKPNPIKQMERDLIGRNIPGYFPTPRPVVERMLELAQIEAETKVLEGSAGKGNIADLIREQHPGCYLSVIEINQSLREILIAKGHELIGNDFLQHQEKYSYIVINPPFENGQDIEHVRHAYNLLYPGGRLVSIMGEGAFFRSDKKATEFRNWFESVNGYEEKLPSGSFLDSERSTGVATRLVVISKSNSPIYARSDNSNTDNTNNTNHLKLLSDGNEIFSLEPKDEALVNEIKEVSEIFESKEIIQEPVVEEFGLLQYLSACIGQDFLDHQGIYSKMIIEGYNIRHIYHAYGLLAVGGTIRARVNKTVFTSMDKDSVLFRKWLKTIDSTREEYPKNTHFVLITKTTLF